MMLRLLVKPLLTRCSYLILYYDMCLLLEEWKVILRVGLRVNTFLPSIIMNRIGVEYKKCKCPTFRIVSYRAVKAECSFEKDKTLEIM